MIRKAEMYQAVCDGGCGRKFAMYKTKESAFIAAVHIGCWEEIDGHLYCPDCVEWDEETKSYKPKNVSNEKHLDSERQGRQLVRLQDKTKA